MLYPILATYPLQVAGGFDLDGATGRLVLAEVVRVEGGREAPVADLLSRFPVALPERLAGGAGAR